jgi:hypothetical protein
MESATGWLTTRLAPILDPVSFFSADLVQRRIDAHGGAIAFVDDFTAWVTGPTAQSIGDCIETITTIAAISHIDSNSELPEGIEVKKSPTIISCRS